MFQFLISATISAAISFLILNHEIIAWLFEDIVDRVRDKLCK